MSLHTLRSILSAPDRTLAFRYILLASAMNLVWEVAQLPLYTIWRTAEERDLVYAVLHCTAGDVMILAAALLLALLLVGDGAWPGRSYARVAVAATTFGVGYAVLSEWLNVEILRNWAYAPTMLLLPPLGTGLTPFLQWLVVPPVALWLVGAAQKRSLLNR